MKYNIKTCTDCIWGDQCQNEEVCDYFSPTENEFNDTYVDKHIETDRQEFYEDWLEYVGEYSDGGLKN